MPIKPENLKRYPPNWADIVSQVRKRAGNKCEQCRIANHAIIKRTGNTWRYPSAEDWDMIYSKVRYGSYTLSQSIKFHGFVKIICTTAHLDHQPENCELTNLKFLCQKCHNQYDAMHRLNTRKSAGLKNQLSLNFTENTI